LQAAAPKQEALKAWDDHIRNFEQQIANAAAEARRFLWTDKSQDMAQCEQRNVPVVTSEDTGEVPQE
jgi:hypothetical protein